MSNSLMTVTEVAAVLSVSTKTVRRLQWSSRLVSCKVGGQVRFLPSDVQRYVESNRIATGNLPLA